MRQHSSSVSMFVYRALLTSMLFLSFFAASAIAAEKTPETTSESAAATLSCIVQAEDLATARSAVIKAGGAIANNLINIQAVNAFLTTDQRATLESMPGVTVRDNGLVNPPSVR